MSYHMCNMRLHWTTGFVHWNLVESIGQVEKRDVNPSVALKIINQPSSKYSLDTCKEAKAMYHALLLRDVFLVKCK